MRPSSPWMRWICARTVQTVGLLTALTALLIGALLAGGVQAGPQTTDYRTTKDGQQTQATTQVVEPGAAEAIDLFPSQGAATTPPPGRTCPATWLFFENRVMHYDLCYPATWGFNDGSSPQPMTSVSGSSLYGVQLMSAEAFPWTVGNEPVAVAATRHAAFVDLDVYQPHVGLPAGCKPATPVPALGATSQWCGEYMRYDGTDLVPDAAGKYYVAKFLIPLATDPMQPSVEVVTTGYELAVTVVTSRSGWTNLGNTILDVIRKIRPL